jgi:hypothetical protein
MKILITILIALMIFISCKTKTKNYPDIDPTQIRTTLLWDSNNETVKKVLTQDFKLKISRVVSQMGPKIVGTIYECIGGIFNGIEVKSWAVTFENDSLIFVSIYMENDDAQKISEFKETLTNALKPDSVNYPNEDRWYLEKDGKRLSDVQISTISSNQIVVTYFKSYPKKLLF